MLVSLRKRRKSRSVEHSTAPCSRAKLANAASVTSGPVLRPSKSCWRKIGQNRSVEASVVTLACCNHRSTMVQACAVDSGCGTARGLVAMRMKASRVCHGSAKTQVAA